METVQSNTFLKKVSTFAKETKTINFSNHYICIFYVVFPSYDKK